MCCRVLSISELSDGGTAALLERLLALLRAHGRRTNASVSKEEQSDHVENAIRQDQATVYLHVYVALPCLALPSGWAGSYTCPALRLYQFGPMHVPKSNHRLQVTAIKP